MPHQDECSAIHDLVDLAVEHGPEAIAAAFAMLMDRDTQIEREQVLKTDSRREPIAKAPPTAASRRR